MMQLLQTEILVWVNPKKINLYNYSDNGSVGCFLEVGVDYSDELHDLHCDYPLPPDKIKVTKKMFEYQFENIEEINFSLGKNEKLFLNLDNKKDTNSIIKKIKKFI